MNKTDPIFTARRIVTLPFPPSVNHYYRSYGRGTVVISKAGKAYRDEVWLSVKRKRFGMPLVGPITLDVTLFRPDNRTRDIDNGLKAMLDALERSEVYHSDSQILELFVRLLPHSSIHPKGAAIVEVW